MSKRIRKLIENLKYILNSKLLRKLAKKTKFLRKDAKFTPEKFISLCVFSSKNVCESSLDELSTWLRVHEKLSITKQGIHNRFNRQSEDFIRSFFNKLLISQTNYFADNEKHLKSIFNSIDVCDSTAFKAPKNLKEYYEGNTGNGTDAIVKIQLEYDLLSGRFGGCKVVDSGESDFAYIPKLKNNIGKNDLKLKDLGYFKVKHLEYVEKSQAFYISRVKTTTAIYEKKDKKFSKINLAEYSTFLREGETIEIPEVYLGSKEKLKSRLILTKLTEENKEKKLETIIKTRKRKGKKVSDLAIKSAALNAYVTNVPAKMLRTEIIHDMYSLRWQVEIMFKIWKSVFDIHIAKPVKIERFNCHLYGKLISLFLSTTIVFAHRDEIYFEHGKQLSEYKAFVIMKPLLFHLKQALFNDEITLLNFFQLINEIFLQNGIKSRRKGEKTSIDIIEGILETFVEEKGIA